MKVVSEDRAAELRHLIAEQGRRPLVGEEFAPPGSLVLSGYWHEVDRVLVRSVDGVHVAGVTRADLAGRIRSHSTRLDRFDRIVDEPVAVLVEFGLEDVARVVFGDGAVDAWSAAQGWSVSDVR